MELDLGEKPIANVKVGGVIHKVTLPNVKQAQAFKERVDLAEGKELDVFIEFMADLGFPKNVCESLTVLQMQTLAEGLMGDPEKK